MSKPIVLTPIQWNRIFSEIKKRENPSTYLSRTKMKEVLGFTNRNHEEWVKIDTTNRQHEDWDIDAEGWFKDRAHRTTVHLDFYDEQKRTMFLLKYGNGEN